MVDDEAAIRDSLRMILEYEGYRVDEAASGAAGAGQGGRAAAGRRRCSTSRCRRWTASSCCGRLRERGYDMPVLMISGHADVATAVEATRRGAYDFFEKPLQRERVLLSLRNAVESSRLQAENRDAAPRSPTS